MAAVSQPAGTMTVLLPALQANCGGSEGQCVSCMGGLPADEAARCRLRLIDPEGTITQCISFLKRCWKAKMCLPMWQLVSQV